LATTLDTLVVRTRRFLRAYPAAQDALTVSITNSATTITIANTALTAVHQTLEVDYETMLVTSISNTTTATVIRGYRGSTPATHAANAPVLIRPGYDAVEIIDALNESKDSMYPYVYRPVLDTSLTPNNITYEFTVPNMPGTYGGDTIPIPLISRIDLLVTGDVSYKRVDTWRIQRAATPLIVFRRAPVQGTLRIHGFGPFPDLTAATDTVDPLFPKNAERVLPIGAAVALLGSGEAGRSRNDTGARDDREAANKPGNAISLANQLERRFEKDLARVAQPPLPKTLVSTL
jgi:hypothetical protein